MRREKSMEGKRVLITGSGTGIGRGVALTFAEEGASVALHYSHSSEGAESAAAIIVNGGGKARAFRANFDNIEEAKRLASESVEFLGGLDILINNAGITFNRPFREVTVNQFDRLFDVNFKSPFFLTQTVVPHLAENQNGVIINIASNHAFFGLRDHTVYAATKGAVVAFTRVLALELAPLGVRVNTIAPGWIRVENHDKVLGSDFDYDSAAAGIPSGFIGQPSDIADLALFLASPKSRYIIGQTILIDGGGSAVMPTTDIRRSLLGQFGTGYVQGSA